MLRVIISLALILGGLRGLTQITIDRTDMPNPGDTLRVSISTIIPVDYTKTGMDMTWDFSTLFAMNQQLDSFVTKQSTPTVFQFFFSNANLASPGGVPSIPGLPTATPFTFYEKAAGFFDDLGFAFTLTGIPIPAKYDHPDEYYVFPLTSGSTWSSNSSASLSFPGLASYYTSRNRTNMVDGWGTVITPLGTFQTIRVKSHLIQKDSIYFDTLGIGIPITRDITQYKWLAKGKGIPVLQINQEGPVSTAIYRDFYRKPIGIKEKTYELLKLFPNPTDGMCHLQLSKPEHSLTLQVLTAHGNIRKEIMIDPSSPGTLEINLSDLPSGLYILQLFDGQTGYRGKLILQSHKTMTINDHP